MLSKNKLNDLWQAGFCRVLIERVKHTTPGPAGAKTRVELTEQHITQERCRDCRYANTMKHVEVATAQLMGPQAVALFLNGGNISHLPGFAESFRTIMNKAIAKGFVNYDILEWTTVMVSQRAGQSYPYTEDDDASQTN